MTHLCVSNLTIISSDNGLSPGRRQAIIWTNAGMLLIGPLGTNFNEVLIEIHTFSLKKNPFKNAVWNMAAILSRPQCVKDYHPRLKITDSGILGPRKTPNFLFRSTHFNVLLIAYNHQHKYQITIHQCLKSKNMKQSLMSLLRKFNFQWKGNRDVRCVKYWSAFVEINKNENFCVYPRNPEVHPTQHSKLI